MIRSAILTILAFVVMQATFGQELRTQQRPARRGENAGYGSRDATVLSMMGWGLGLGIGIATLCALIPNNEAGGGGGGGGGAHSH